MVEIYKTGEFLPFSIEYIYVSKGDHHHRDDHDASHWQCKSLCVISGNLRTIIKDVSD